jgi:hypothetical protein
VNSTPPARSSVSAAIACASGATSSIDIPSALRGDTTVGSPGSIRRSSSVGNESRVMQRPLQVARRQRRGASRRAGSGLAVHRAAQARRAHVGPHGVDVREAVGLGPRTPTSRQPAGTARNVGQIEYCSSSLMTTV